MGKSVDGILRVFTKTIDQLEVVARQEGDKAEKIREKRRILLGWENDAMREAGRASNVALKLREVVEA